MSTHLQSRTPYVPREFIRSTSIGGLLAAGIALLLYFYFPAYIALVNQHWFYIVYTAIGAALAKAIKHTWRSVRKPPSKPATLDEKLKVLDILHEQKRISDDKYQELVYKLCEKEFLE